MLDRFGVPWRDDRSRIAPDDRARDADADLVRRTAAWLRVDGAGALTT